MRFLADMGISPNTVNFLQDIGHHAVHLHQEGLDRLTDSEILDKARHEESILLTHDLDFGDLLAAGGVRTPSVIIFRLRNMRPERVNARLLHVIAHHTEMLDHGAVVIVAEAGVRVRPLPFFITK